jgi:hypothetical protein
MPPDKYFCIGKLKLDLVRVQTLFGPEMKGEQGMAAFIALGPLASRSYQCAGTT